MMDAFFRDLKHVLRLLARAPGFTLVVTGALALAIGANTAVFSLLNAVLFNPLPYPQAGRIVMLNTRFTGIGLPEDRNLISPPEFLDLQRFANSFAALAAYVPSSVNLRVGELPERYSSGLATAQFFDALAVKPQIGRTFTEGEDQEGRDTVIVLGYNLWQRRFNGDRDVAGRAINVNGRPYTIIGVMPQGFAFPAEAEAWTPLVFPASLLAPNGRTSHSLSVIARVKPELTMERALGDMDRVTRQIMEASPAYPYSDFNFKVLVRPLIEDFVSDIRPALLLLMGAVGFVLLIACSNVANLLLVRASGRTREVGIRAALGAGRGRLIRQLLTESVVLSLAGAAVGLAIAWGAVRSIATFGGTAFPRLAETQVDGLTLLFTAGVAVLTGMLFGLAPAWQASGSKASEALRDRGSTTSRASNRLRRALVAAEIALALALVCGAGLLIKSFVRLQQVDPGFDAEGVVTMRVALPAARYAERQARAVFFNNLMDRVRQINGVESAGAINALPLSGVPASATITIDTAAVPLDQASPEADQRVVMPGYFASMGTRLLDGRDFAARDRNGGELVAIVDRTLANKYWPGESAIGKRVRLGGQLSAVTPWRTVVGVAEHTRFESLERPSRVQIYLPMEQQPQLAMSLVLKSRMDVAALAGVIQRETVTLDADQPVYAVRPMTELMADAVRRRQLVMAMLGVFAGIALTLAALGIYGVMSYWVTQRRNEIGIRMALGATRGNVLGLVMGQSAPVVAIGVAVGLGGSLVLTRLMAALLFDVAPNDAATLAAVSAGLVAVGLAATLIPAIRATRVQPMQALREE